MGILLCVVYRHQADQELRAGLVRSISSSYTTASHRDPVTLSWDLVMASMQCCGVDNYTDFHSAAKFQAGILEEVAGSLALCTVPALLCLPDSVPL